MVGEQIKRFRLEAGLTQKELAEKSGVTQQCISKYEKYPVNYDYHILVAIFDTLGITIEFKKKTTAGGA